MQFCRHSIDKFFRAVLYGRNNFKVFQALILYIFAEALQLCILGKVNFIACHNLRTLCQFGIELYKLFVDFFKIFNRVAPLTTRNIHHVHKHSATLHMAQKFVSQAHTLGGALNQSGNIRHYKALFGTHGNNAEYGRDGGEMVIADNRFGFADHGNQRGFADVRKAQKPDVRNQL